MIVFTCAHCEKPINGLTIVIDKTHLVHSHCEEAFMNGLVVEDLLNEPEEENLTEV